MWWRTDKYEDEAALPDEFYRAAGVMGPALIRVFKDGSTDPGWGEKHFMKAYQRNAFSHARAVHAYAKYEHPFAIVMRSVDLVCIDIDGKNGGIENAGKLGMLPYTLAETSKSGDGYHLFYRVTEDMWDSTYGFALFKDRIGIAQGVDFRSTGCVYHYPGQRWNSRPVVELPQHFKETLLRKTQKEQAIASVIVKTLATGDEEEVAIMHDEMLRDLAKPIPAGKRNNTLFAIGSQMAQAQVPDWETLISDRAKAVGLDADEADKLVKNIQKYGVVVSP